MRRLVALMALLLTVAACGGEPAATVPASTTTAAPTSLASSTTLPSTTTRPVRPSTTTTTSPDAAPVGGQVTLPAIAPAPGTFSFSPWADGFAPEIGEAYLAGAWEVDPATFDLVPDLVVEMPSTANGGVVVRPDGTMSVTYHIRPEAVW